MILTRLKHEKGEFIEIPYKSSQKEKKWCEIFLQCAKVTATGSHCVSK